MARRQRTVTCPGCGQTTDEPRRGLCRSCYLKQWRGTGIPQGASCAGCAEPRRVLLQLKTIAGARVPLCYNCSQLLRRIVPPPSTLAAFHGALQREVWPEEKRAALARLTG